MTDEARQGAAPTDRHDEKAALGSALVVFVGTGYLGALALAVGALGARPVAGGLAAMVTIVLSRVLQVALDREATTPTRAR